ncbi:MAG: tyrosine-type recombinase/integrase [Bacteroidota bacterium]
MFLSRVRGIYYLFFIDEAGTRRKLSTRCSRKSDALTFLRNFKVSEFERRKKLRRIFLSVFMKEFSDFASGTYTQKTASTYRTAFQEFLRIVGDLPLRSIGIREIERFLSTKKAEASSWTARKYYIALRSAFEKAVQWNYLTENPFRKVPKPKTPEILPAFFTENEFRLFLSTVEDRDFRELCITALLTGVRLGELLALLWSDVDLTRRLILVRNSDSFTTKTGKNRTIPMNDELYRLLRLRKENLRIESEFVFHKAKGRPLKPGTVSGRFKKHVRAAGLNDKLHFHSLRHSFASALVASGVSLFAVQKLLGHTTSKTTEIYSHLLPQQLHEEVERIRGFVQLPSGEGGIVDVGTTGEKPV